MSKIKINQDSLKTSREWVRHRVERGSNVYRILPPYGDVSVHNNFPYTKWSIAWLVDPRTGKRRPFASPLSDGEPDCPVKEFQDAFRTFLDNKKSQLEASGASKEQVKEELEDLYQVQWQIKIQHLYAYNACDKSGNVGLLEIKSTAHKALKKKMAEYISLYTQDPTSLGSASDDSGVWFNFTKEGTGKDTVYGVDFNKDRFKDDQGRLVSAEDRSALPPNVVEGYNELGYDLSKIYHRKTYSELREILLYNLSILSETIPEVVLPGFELDSAPAAAPVTQASTSAKPQGSNKVALNLGDDDEDRGVSPVAQASAVSTKTDISVSAHDSDIESLKELADSVLGD